MQEYAQESVAKNMRNTLVDLNQQFFVVAGRYKAALTEFYLANTKENNNAIEMIKRDLTRIYAKTFMTSSQIHTTILENNDKILSLDKYLDELKAEVQEENKALQNVENTGQAAVPRKRYIRKNMQGDYYMDAFYFSAVLGGIYYFITYYKNRT